MNKAKIVWLGIDLNSLDYAASSPFLDFPVPSLCFIPSSNKSAISSLCSDLHISGTMQELQQQTLTDRIQDNELDDFSFLSLNPDRSPISAEDAFLNGQIRSVFPLAIEAKTKEPQAVRPPLKNLFMEELISPTENRSNVSPDEWSASAAPTTLGKKSHSTGFSKLWRFGEKIRRSSSDGKEAFVFLRSDSSESGGEKAAENRKGGKRTKGETASCYHERLYTRNRAEKEINKRKSFLPYRSNLMGFFGGPNAGSNRNF